MTLADAWTAGMEDAYAIAELQVEAWRFAYRDQMSDPYLDALEVEPRANMWQSALYHPDVRIVAVGPRDAPTAFVGYGPPQDAEPRELEGEIYALYQRESARGTGLAKGLCLIVFDDLRGRGCRSVTVCALKSNENAHGFYQHLGFVIEGERQAYDLDGFLLDEFLFRRPL